MIEAFNSFSRFANVADIPADTASAVDSYMVASTQGSASRACFLSVGLDLVDAMATAIPFTVDGYLEPLADSYTLVPEDVDSEASGTLDLASINTCHLQLEELDEAM